VMTLEELAARWQAAADGMSSADSAAAFRDCADELSYWILQHKGETV
jgi:hypothetical protein